MKWKVIGWTDYDYHPEYKTGMVTNAMVNAIVDDIIENKYIFTGYHHQEYSYCAPVLNNGKCYLFTSRGFGYMMALAHKLYGPFDYSLFDYVNFDFKGYKLPTYRDPDDSKIVRKLSTLNEEYHIKLTKKNIETLTNENYILVRKTQKLKFIDHNDKVIFEINGKTKKKVVKEVIEQQFMSEELKRQMLNDYHNYKDKEIEKKAREFFQNYPFSLKIIFK